MRVYETRRVIVAAIVAEPLLRFVCKFPTGGAVICQESATSLIGDPLSHQEG